MYTKPEICPNPDCQHHNPQNNEKKFFIKKGFYKTKHNHQPVPKYQCKSCGKYFSSHTFKDTYRQHKPFINKMVQAVLCSSMTLRRAAGILGIAKKTVEKKRDWLAEDARKKHLDYLNSEEAKTSYVQFDEMETCQGNKKRPLSISLAIQGKNGKILDAQVAKMRLKGKLATKNPDNKKHWDIDNRKEATERVMLSVKKVAKKNITIASDKKRAYPNIIKGIIPNANIQTYKRNPKETEINPLFMLNITCAKIRADLSRMRRRTWAITRKWENLQKHLYMYIAWNNKYPGWGI